MRVPALYAVLAILCGLLLEGSVFAQGQPREAPVGHRQPTQNNLPQQPEQTSTDKRLKELDDALAKKLKSICRGC
jgi:hypothetical protein